MPFNIGNFSRGAFINGSAIWRYVTDDATVVIAAANYFGDAWEVLKGEDLIITSADNGLVIFSVLSSDDSGVVVQAMAPGMVTADTFTGPGAFEAMPGVIYPIDSSSGEVAVTLSGTFSAGDCFSIEDHTLSFSLNNVTVDFSPFNYYGGTSNYVGNEDGETPVFCLRDAPTGFVVN